MTENEPLSIEHLTLETQFTANKISECGAMSAAARMHGAGSGDRVTFQSIFTEENDTKQNLVVSCAGHAWHRRPARIAYPVGLLSIFIRIEDANFS